MSYIFDFEEIEKEKKTITGSKTEGTSQDDKFTRQEEAKKWESAFYYDNEKDETYYGNEKDTESAKLWRRIKISLALIGMATIIGATAVAARKAYDWGYSLTEGFWDETKERMEQRRREYEMLYGKSEENSNTSNTEIPNDDLEENEESIEERE